MLKKILVATLTAAMILGISITAFADEEDTNMQDDNVGGYNEYGLSYAAMDALTISLNEATAKYPVTQIIQNEDYTTVIFQNGFTMDYYDDWTDLFTDTDESGKNLFVYFDITLPSADAAAAYLAEKGYSVIYDYVDAADLPVNTCSVDSVSQSVMINAGFTEPVYWDIDSDGQGRMTMSYSYNDTVEPADETGEAID